MVKMYSPCCQRTCYIQKVTVLYLNVSQRGPQNPENHETMQNGLTSTDIMSYFQETRHFPTHPIGGRT